MTRSPLNPFQDLSEAWSSLYPTLHWILDHPVGSLLLTLVGIYCFWGLLRGLVQLTESLWISLLKLPWHIVQWLWQRAGNPRLPFPHWRQAEPDHTQVQLLDLLRQLEETHQHQAQLIGQVREALKNRAT